MKDNPLYLETEKKIRRSIHLLSVISLVVVTLVWALLFLRETYVQFEEEKTKIADEYLEQQRSILRGRVDTVSDFIVTYRQQAEERLRRTVSERVDRTHATATAIIEENSDHLSEPELQHLVVETLRSLRWRDGNSYIWINTYDLDAVLFPTEPNLEGTSLAGHETVYRQAETACLQGSGFNRDFFRKPGGAPDEEVAQISYVRDLGYWDWYLGSAEFLDDFERDLQDELLDVIAQFRYGDNYVFIDTFDGYALLMNGMRLDPPQYAWELEDSQGLKILQEQLRVAQANPDGGFLSYIWYEKSLGRDMEYLSFVRTIDDWEWKIGTGKYLQLIEDEIARREAVLWQRTWNSLLIGSVMVGGVLLVVLLASLSVNRRISSVFASLRSSLQESHQSLLDLNANLEQRIREETGRSVSMHRLSITDALTGLANRRQFEEVLDIEWRRAACSGRSLSLIMADIDRFKDYNDALGHRSGDRALIQVAEELRRASRRVGNVAVRYGGEEFAVILPETTLSEAFQVARRIHFEVAALAIPHPASDVGLTLSLSLGVASISPCPDGDPVMLVEAADRALYAAKRKGRNRIECAKEERMR